MARLIKDAPTLSEVTLLVLSVLAIAAIRDRTASAQTSKSISNIERDMAALLSGEPYHVVDYTSALTVSEGGADAVTTRTKKIQFDQNSVLSISDLSQTTGDAESYVVRPPSLERVAELPRGGQMHSLISLGRPWNRGEELEFTIEERLKDAFLANREDLTVDIGNPTERLVLSVTWRDREVENVFVERFGKLVAIDMGELKTAPNGGSWYTRTFDQPQVGETISIVWDWAEPPAGAHN